MCVAKVGPIQQIGRIRANSSIEYYRRVEDWSLIGFVVLIKFGPKIPIEPLKTRFALNKTRVYIQL